MSEPATRILLIEDNPDDAYLLRESLTGFGQPSIELVHAEQLDHGLQHLRSDDFDVILLDLSLPDSQGIDTLLRVQGEATAAPIIVLTTTAVRSHRPIPRTSENVIDAAPKLLPDS